MLFTLHDKLECEDISSVEFDVFKYVLRLLDDPAQQKMWRAESLQEWTDHMRKAINQFK